MAESAFMTRQRKLLEDIKDNNGVPPLKSIYAEGTPTVKAQDRINTSVGNVLQGLANTAESFAGGAGLRKIATPIINAREKQKKFLSDKEINSMPDARSTAANPHGQTSNIVSKPLQELSTQSNQSTALDQGKTLDTYGVPKNQITVAMSGRDNQIKNNLSKIDEMLASGAEVSPEQMERIQNIRQQAGFLRGGTDRVQVDQDNSSLKNSNSFQRGNLDITFDDSVDQRAQKRFLEDPVRPTAQIDRYNKRQNNQGELSQGQLASLSANSIINPPKVPEQEEPQLLTKENSDMGWQARRDLNKQILSNYQSGVTTQANNLASLQENKLTNTVRQNMSDRDNLTRRNIATKDNAIQSERNRILDTNNIRRDETNKITANAKQRPESKVIKKYGPAGNVIGEEIVQQDADGNWPNQTAVNPPKKMAPETAAKKLLQMRSSNDSNLAAAESEYVKVYGKLPY